MKTDYSSSLKNKLIFIDTQKMSFLSRLACVLSKRFDSKINFDPLILLDIIKYFEVTLKKKKLIKISHLPY